MPSNNRPSRWWWLLVQEPVNAWRDQLLERRRASPPEWQIHYSPPVRSEDSAANAAKFKNGKRTILACDGGGILGIITLHCLKALEECHRSSIFEMFDMFAGTSTGAIIAAGLAAGVPVSELINLYTDKRQEIFSRTPWNTGLVRVMLDPVGVAIPVKYHKQPIRSMLRSA
ncbi:MAG: patatin-like phospholipase family protein, partial [Chloroflexi bacterium]|nr:patatin-like phospholipase family protein [Chloroflexota bacterium]